MQSNIMDQLTCHYCKVSKPAESFHPSERTKETVAIKCIECVRAYNHQWYERRKRTPYYQDRMRKLKEAQWKHTYGINRAEYERLLAEQGGVCAICKQPETRKFRGTLRSMSVDHCHATTTVRGLLCQACNTGLGHFSDDVSLLQSAIAYLQKC